MPFTFGGVFSRFFKIIGDSFVPLAIIGMIFTVLPAIALYYGIFNLTGLSPINWPSQIQSLGFQTYGLLGGGILIAVLFNLVSVCAVTEIAILGGVGKKAELGPVLSHALGNCVPVLIVNIIVAVVTLLASLLFIIPGIMFMLAAYVAIPAYVGEQGVGLWGAVKRSFDLTRNHRWLILGILIVASFAMGMISGALGGVYGTFAFGSGGQSPAAMADPSVGLSIFQGFINGLSTMAGQIFTVAIYVCLRQSKEKATPAGAAAVFE